MNASNPYHNNLFTETDEEREAAKNDLLAALESPDHKEFEKCASADGSTMIRRRVRENGFLRSIVPPVGKRFEDCDRTLDSTQHRIIEDMESNSRGAVVLSFNDAADSDVMRANRFEIVFFKISTAHYYANVDELKTNRMDLRAVTTDNALKDLQTTEDVTAKSYWDAIVGPTPDVAGLSGYVQYQRIVGQISRKSYKNIVTPLQTRFLNNGVCLINRIFAAEFLGWGRDEWGGDIAETLAKDGLSGLPAFKLFGMPHIATIKHDVIGNGTTWQFTEPGYFGRFYTLEDLTMYVERRREIIRFNAEEKIGLAFPNVAAVNRIDFAYQS